MRKTAIYLLAFTFFFLGAFLSQAPAQSAVRTGEITKIDAAAKSFVVKTARGETNIVTTDNTVFKEGDTQIKFEDLKVGDNIQVKGERKGDDVEAQEVVKEGASHGHDHRM
ncbi:MAG: hypothetical protein HYX74_04035 [Acidobacteria bacterium]|nr:hypothetical protein [Acidobacteriota bacterium]